MKRFEIEANGRKFEVEAADFESAMRAAQQYSRPQGMPTNGGFAGMQPLAVPAPPPPPHSDPALVRTPPAPMASPLQPSPVAPGAAAGPTMPAPPAADAIADIVAALGGVAPAPRPAPMPTPAMPGERMAQGPMMDPYRPDIPFDPRALPQPTEMRAAPVQQIVEAMTTPAAPAVPRMPTPMQDTALGPQPMRGLNAGTPEWILEAMGAPAPEEPVYPQAADVNPPGTLVGREFKRGVLSTGASLPQAQAMTASTLLSDYGRTVEEIFADELRNMGPAPTEAMKAQAQANAAMRFGLVEGMSEEEYAELLKDAVGSLVKADDLLDRAEAIPRHPRSQQALEILAQTPDEVGATLTAIKDNPLAFATFLAEVGVQSSPQIIASLLTGAVTGSPVASTAVMGAGAIGQEYAASAREFLREEGVEIRTPEDAVALLNDPEMMRKASERGATRGLVIAAMEMLGQKVAGAQLGRTAVGNQVAQTGVQMATGGGGEALASLAAGQDLSAQEILLEAMAEGITAPAEIGVAAASSRTPRREDRGGPPLVPPAPAPDAPPSVSRETPATPEGGEPDGLRQEEELRQGRQEEVTPPTQIPPAPPASAGTSPGARAAPPVPSQESAAPGGGRWAEMEETETVDGQSVPTGRRVRVNLDTGQVQVVGEESGDAEAPPRAADEPQGGDAGGARPAVRAGDAPVYEDLTSEDVAEIGFDPRTFQYKDGGNEQGVTERLQGVDQWDRRAAGNALIYEYADGRRVIADGHQRLGLAQRLQGQGVDTPWRAEVLREVDGYTPADARRIAAMVNIKNDSGTALDAAKVLRDGSEGPTTLGLPVRSQMVQDAIGISKLSDQAFGMVVNERATQSNGGIVGRVVEDPRLHADILALLARVPYQNKFQAEAIARQAASETRTETQTSLFGDEEIARNLYLERAKVLDGAVKRLRQDERTFQALVERADAISAEGNQLATQQNEQRLASDARLREYLSRQANTKGPISDALSSAARRVADGDRTSQAIDDFIRAVRNQLEGGQPDRGRVPPPREGAPAPDGSPGADAGREEVAPETTPEEDLLAAMGAPAKPQAEPKAEPKADTKPAPRSTRPAARDLFDQGSDSQPGERQTDIEDLIAERAEREPKDDIAEAMGAPPKPRKPKKRAAPADKPPIETVTPDEAPAPDVAAQMRERLDAMEKKYRVTTWREDREAGTVNLSSGPEFNDLIARLAAAPDAKAREAAADAWVLDRGKETGLEHLVFLDADGFPLAVARGDKANIGFPPHFMRMGREGIVAYTTHNHPSGQAFSGGDINVTLSFKGARIVAVGHTGTRYEAEPGPLAVQLPDFFLDPKATAMRRAHTRIDRTLFAKMQGELSGAQVRGQDTANLIDLFNRTHAALINVVFERLGILTLRGDAERLAQEYADGRQDLDSLIRGVVDAEVFEELGGAGLDVAALRDRLGAERASRDEAADGRDPGGDRPAQEPPRGGDGSGRVPVAPDIIPVEKPPRARASKKSAMTDAEKARLDAIKREFADKLRNQINTGLDPRLVQLAIEAAGIYVKAGARKFRDFLLDMADDFGLDPNVLGRYARIAYNDVRDEMEYEGQDVADMDSAPAVLAVLKEIADVPGPGSDLESDRGDAAPSDGVGAADVPAPGGRSGARSGSRGGASRGRGGQRARRGGVPDGDAAGVGGRGDPAVSGEVRPDGQPADDRDGAGGRGDRERGLPDDRGSDQDLTRNARDETPVSDRVARQRAADRKPIRLGDEQNIRDTLPLLLPEQQDDVLKVEQRFAKPDGHGMLITNGTGTGKTYSAGGVIKRFVRQGKDNVLVVAPSQGILDAWQGALADLGVTATKLKDTGSAGEGVTLTTYANFGMNNGLATRDWDLIVPDEAHYLSLNQAGDPTLALNALRAITNHPRGLWARGRMLNADKWEVYKKLPDSPAKSAMWAELDAESKRFQAEYEKKPRSKVLFLSATPFAYDKNVDYAEGYLFDYGAGGVTESGSRQDGRNLFMVSNFGYRIRYHKLTKPEAAVDSGVFEREFHEKLKRDGMLSGRSLDIAADYDRKFSVIEDKIGEDIDQILAWVGERARGGDAIKRKPWEDLEKAINRSFTFLKRRMFLEQIKARAAVKDVEKHLALGRKVVVFHDYNVGGGVNPFRGLPDNDATTQLYAAFPQIETWDFSAYPAPVDTFAEAFGKRVGFYSSRVPDKKRRENLAAFNRDDSGLDVLVMQANAGREGVSAHDTTGGKPRVLINLGMPVQPTTAIQQEGRIRRTGSVSDAIFRYYTTGTAWERMAFAGGIAEKSGTVENLALGDEARTIRDSFIEAYMEAEPLEPNANEGKGGKDRDRAVAKTTPWQRAISHYFARMKNTAKRQNRRGVDFYATPEPVGVKMVEWARVGAYEKVLEPSAGDGAIARYFPGHADRTIVEPSFELRSEAQLRAPGARLHEGDFESLHVVNKYHAIVMNPPYGSGGKTAIEHLAKAAKHLKEGGRIVALIPTGPAADKRFDAWYESDEAKGFHLNGEYRLPSVTFEKAGTAVATRIVIIDRITDPMVAAEITTRRADLTGADSIQKLFDRIENLSGPERSRVVEAADPFEDADAAEQADTDEAPAVQIHVSGFDLAETTHSKTGDKLWVATFQARVEREVYDAAKAEAKKHGGWYSSFRGRGAIPGFQFKSEAGRQAFVEAMNAPVVSKDQRLDEPDAPFVREFLAELASVDDIFRYPRATSMSVSGVFAEIDPTITFVGEVGQSEDTAELGATERYLLRTAKAEDLYVMVNDEEVWIDVSRLEPGSGGSAVYAAVSDFAFNTDRVFIGDPAGITDVAIVRRTDAMLSSALKHGTTRHLAPHPDQIDGKPDRGISPLPWTVGDDSGNVEALIEASAANAAALVPEIADARYDFSTGTILTGEGQPVSDGTLDKWASAAARGGAPRLSRASLKRGALLSALLRASGGEQPGLLERVLRQSGQLVDRGLRGTFYERPRDYVRTVQLRASLKEILPDLRAELDRLNLKRVRLGELREDGAQARFDVDRMNGMTILIHAALAGPNRADYMESLHHEAIHALRALDLFTPREWATLEQAAARRWVEQYDIANRYPDLLPSEQIEEVIAEAFADHARTRKAPANDAIRQAFTKIDRFFRALWNALQGKGFTTPEAVFGRVLSGEIGGRDRGAVPRLMAAEQREVVAELRGDELGKAQDMRSLGRAAEQWYRENLVGTTATHRATGMVVQFNNAGARKIGGRKGETLFKLVPAIREIIEGGRLVETLADRQARDNVRAIHKIAGRVVLGGQSRDVVVTVREMRDGTFHYDLSRDMSDGARFQRDGRPAVKAGSGMEQGSSPVELNIDLEVDEGNAGVGGSGARIGAGSRSSPSADVSTAPREGLGYGPAGASSRRASAAADTMAGHRALDFLSQPPLLSKDQRPRTMRTPTPQGRAHMAAGGMAGRLFVPDRRIWEELTAANAGLWDRLRGGTAAAHDWIDKARIKLQDRFLPVLRAQQAVERGIGAVLPEEQNAYAIERTFSGKVGRHLDEIDQDYTKPIIDLLGATKGGLTVDDVGDWLYARHAIERNARIAEINKDMPDGGSGMLTEEAVEILDAAKASPHRATYERIGALIDRLRERNLKLREDAGLISNADAALWRSMYKYYVPLKGFAETDHAEAMLDITGVGRRFNTRGPESRRHLGRYSTAFNPLVAALTQAQEVAIRAEKNRVGQAVYNLAKTHPSKALWEVKKPKTTRYFNKTTGMVETRVEDPMSLIMQPNEMAVKVNGQERRVIFHDERVARSLGNVGAYQMGLLATVMMPFSQMFSAVNTMLNPVFTVVNGFRDMITAQIMVGALAGDDAGKVRRAILRNWGSAFLAAYRGQRGAVDTEWTKWYREFEESGAKISFWRLDQPEAGKSDLQARVRMASSLRGQASRLLSIRTRDNPILNVIERANLAVDNAARLAAYRAARENGWSKQEAARLAKELTVNFNRRGEWGASINAFFPFFNAAVQGSTAILRAVLRARAKSVGMAVLGMAAGGLISDLVNAALSERDDDDELVYDKVPDWKLKRNIVLGTEGVGFEFNATVPLPYGFNVFWYGGVQLGKVVRGVKPVDAALADLAAATFAAFSPITGEHGAAFVTPTVFDPMLQMTLNRDWLGRPIRPENAYADYGPDAYKYFSGASQASRVIADVLNRATGGDRAQAGFVDISPEYIDHMTAHLFGGFGRFIGQSSDIVVKLATGQISEIEPHRIPFRSQVAYTTGPWLDRDRYYRFRHEVRQAQAAVKVYAEEGRRVPRELARKAALSDPMRDIERRLRQTRDARRALDANDTLSAESRNERKERIAAAEARLFLAFNRRYLAIAGPQAE